MKFSLIYPRHHVPIYCFKTLSITTSLSPPMETLTTGQTLPRTAVPQSPPPSSEVENLDDQLCADTNTPISNQEKLNHEVECREECFLGSPNGYLSGEARIERAWAHWNTIGRPRLIVAPMVDCSELPFRLLCKKYGAQAAYTPMLHSRMFTETEKYRSSEFTTCKEDRPLFVQFCANDPAILLEAAKRVEPFCDYVDINLGFVGLSAVATAKSSNYSFQISKSFTFSAIKMENSSHSRGALVVLEGLDRSGKSSQSSNLVSNLEGLGIAAELLRFPDRSTSVGQMISAYLSNKSELDDRTIHLLFSANRWEKRSSMEAKLKSGTTLVVDRYSYSGVAFSSAKGLDVNWCKAPEVGLLAPDLVLYLDISPEKAAERGGYGNERYEHLDFQKRVAEKYQLLRDESWKTIDACLSIKDVEEQVQATVLECVNQCRQGKPLSQLWPQ